MCGSIEEITFALNPKEQLCFSLQYSKGRSLCLQSCAVDCMNSWIYTYMRTYCNTGFLKDIALVNLTNSKAWPTSMQYKIRLT